MLVLLLLTSWWLLLFIALQLLLEGTCEPEGVFQAAWISVLAQCSVRVRDLLLC
jgi:hypothetical protein